MSAKLDQNKLGYDKLYEHYSIYILLNVLVPAFKKHKHDCKNTSTASNLSHDSLIASSELLAKKLGAVSSTHQLFNDVTNISERYTGRRRKPL